jgi:hypothetical protein
MKKMVTITEEEYKELLDKADFLECLLACGVDNWSGYGYAVDMYNEEAQEVVEVVEETVVVEEDYY